MAKPVNKKRVMLTARILVEVPETRFSMVRQWVIRRIMDSCGSVRWGMVAIRLYDENGEMLGTNSFGRMDPSMKRQLDAIFDGEDGAA